MDKPTPKPRNARVRCYEFEYGLLYLKRFMHVGLSDQAVADLYGQGKGKLLEAWDDVINLKYLNSLEDFTEQ